MKHSLNIDLITRSFFYYDRASYRNTVSISRYFRYCSYFYLPYSPREKFYRNVIKYFRISGFRLEPLKSHRHNNGINFGKTGGREEGSRARDRLARRIRIRGDYRNVCLLSLPPAVVDERIKRLDTFRSFG